MGQEHTDSALERLARAHGIELEYQHVFKGTVRASPDALLAALRALRVPIEKPEQASEALSAWEESEAARLVEPVFVSWAGAPLVLEFQRADPRLPASCLLKLANGEVRDLSSRLDAAPVQTRQIGGRVVAVQQVALDGGLPFGYHELLFEEGHREARSTVISAPPRAYVPPMLEKKPGWGVFLPIYALSSLAARGIASLSEFENVLRWVNGLGGGVVATLPILAAFSEGACADPSPYSPASRLFWNDLYADLGRSPELTQSPRAMAGLEAIRAIEPGGEVDYCAVAAARRKVWDELAQTFFEQGSPDRRAAFQGYLEAQPLAEEYAAFRARTDKHGAWLSWPSGGSPDF
ncbi:MAG: 4-alpha-glucanotransferase, partial [Verrucomicrobiae bacterium]|nr:4-alpha-glucanotransferase [Verrucomicrobiae bacterium]